MDAIHTSTAMAAGSHIRVVDVTAIIPTKNRPEDLVVAVESLYRQTAVPRELIIVDQSETEVSRNRIKALVGGMGELQDVVSLQYIYAPTITSASVARNIAIERAQGSILLFLDDDVILEPAFMEEIVAVYARMPEVSGVSGIITNYPPLPLLPLLWRKIFMLGPFHDPRQKVYWRAESLRHAEPIQVDRFGGGLMSFRDSAISRCRFDENLCVAYGEDVDFCMQLPQGSTLVITPRARLVHNQSLAGRLKDHPLHRDARSQYFLYLKNWKHGIWNRLCFLWLNLGYGIVASVGSLKRGTLDPWHAFRTGVNEGKAVVAGINLTERTALGLAPTQRSSKVHHAFGAQQ